MSNKMILTLALAICALAVLSSIYITVDGRTIVKSQASGPPSDAQVKEWMEECGNKQQQLGKSKKPCG